MALSKSELLRARIMWVMLALTGVSYCIFAGIVAVLVEDASLLEWRGFLDADPPVSLGILIAVGAPLLIFWIVLCRQIVFSLLVRKPDPFSAEQPEPPDFQTWLRPHIISAMLAELPLTGALVWSMLFGMLPLLWVMAAETVAMMLIYMPRAETSGDAA